MLLGLKHSADESFENFREDLVLWLKQSVKPNESHKILLQIYINDCIEYDRLENIMYLLKYLKRFALNNINWKNVCCSIIDYTQKKIQIKYTYKLQL